MAKNSKKWFKKVRSSYIPISWQGWLSYLPYVAFLVLTYLYIMYSFGYSVMSLLIIIPNWVAAVAVMSWVASKKS
jgi:hypothetical protein